MSDSAIQPDHAEIEALLPWFVNGTLSTEESEYVAEHVERCSECNASLQEYRRVAKVVEADTATPLVPSPPVDDFLRKLENQESVRESRQRWSAVALAASVIVILTAGVLFFALDQEEVPQVFHAVGDPQTDEGIAYIFDISYSEGAHESVRNSVTDQFADATLVEYDGGYRMIIPLQSASVRELETFAESLQTLHGVQQVDVVGVQLPLE